MTVPEIIAQLDVMEREVDLFKLRLRTLRQDLFQTLDADDESVLD